MSAKDLIHHSYRGSQYCSSTYQEELKGKGIITSMSSKGSFYNNAMIDAFFKTLKSLEILEKYSKRVMMQQRP